MNKRMKYLTIKDKKELVIAGKDVPLCVGEPHKRNSCASILQNSIFNSQLKNKNIKI